MSDNNYDYTENKLKYAVISARVATELKDSFYATCEKNDELPSRVLRRLIDVYIADPDIIY